MSNIVPIERIENRIYLIRGRKIMLDFMFQLNRKEYLRCHNVTSSYGGRRYLPFAFTEQGVAMLSSVLSSDRAIMVNIQIMRTFSRLRDLLASRADLKKKIEAIEKKYDGQFKVVFEAIRALIDRPPKKTGKIGFMREEE